MALRDWFGRFSARIGDMVTYERAIPATRSDDAMREADERWFREVPNAYEITPGGHVIAAGEVATEQFTVTHTQLNGPVGYRYFRGELRTTGDTPTWVSIGYAHAEVPPAEPKAKARREPELNDTRAIALREEQMT